MGKMVAISPKEAAFFYKGESAHEVPKSSAEKIAATLNAAGWGLKEGEIWTVYDCFDYERDYTAAGSQSFSIYKGRIREKRKYGIW